MSNYSASEKKQLLDIARTSIKLGLEENKLLKINLDDYSQKLREFGASFVTLEIQSNLRGCVGSLIAHKPLVQDIADNAYAAAFRDPRFGPLTAEEYSEISIHISILSKSEKIKFSSEEDLLAKIRPGVDGLVLSDRGYRSTFLPAVWESLSTPELFLKHLKIKAGLPEDYWSDTIQIERYTAEVIE